MSSSDLTSFEQAKSARVILAENVIRLRHQKGWSQEGLALEAGLHRTFVAHVERRMRNISLDNIERLALALSVPTYVLLTPTRHSVTALADYTS